jgi:iron complex transport system substrate-binding protein
MQRIKFIYTLIAVALLACSNSKPPKPETGKGLRIVSTAPSATEILFALGLGAQVVGVTRYCDYPPEALKLPKVGGFTDLSIEAIMALQPDIVVGSRISNLRPVVEKLEELGIKTAFFPDDDLAQVFSAIREIGAAVGEAEKAKGLSKNLEDRMNQIKISTQAEPAPRVLLIVGWKPIILAARGSFLDTLLQYAGGVNAVQDAKVAYPNYELEAIIRSAPEVIIDASMENPNADIKARWASFTDIPAVKNGKVFMAPSQSLLRPGPRLAEGLSALATLLHPTITIP